MIWSIAALAAATLLIQFIRYEGKLGDKERAIGDLEVRLDSAKRQNVALSDDLGNERIARMRADQQSQNVFEAVAPLIEQTDWMTGRWHGRFAELQRLESVRNGSVENARRVLWDIPVVKKYIEEHKKELLAGISKGWNL